MSELKLSYGGGAGDTPTKDPVLFAGRQRVNDCGAESLSFPYGTLVTGEAHKTMAQIMSQGLSKTGRICPNLTEPKSHPNARALRSNT